MHNLANTSKVLTKHLNYEENIFFFSYVDKILYCVNYVKCEFNYYHRIGIRHFHLIETRYMYNQLKWIQNVDLININIMIFEIM